MTNSSFFTPFALFSPFGLASAPLVEVYVSSLAVAAPAFSHQAALMAHRESLNTQTSDAQTLQTRIA